MKSSSSSQTDTAQLARPVTPVASWAKIPGQFTRRRPLHWVFAALIVIIACCAVGTSIYLRSRTAIAPAVAAHEEAQRISATAWGLDYELFVEAPAPIANQPTKFACHITDLKSGRAFDAGTVAMQLKDESGAVLNSQSVERSRPGIYLVDLRFPHAGKYQCSARIEPAGDPAEEIRLPDCTAYPTLAAVPAHPRIASAAQVVMMPKEQQWRLTVLVRPLERRDLVERLVVPGAVRSPTGASALVTPPASGTLYAPAGGRFPRVGELVEKDQAVAVLEPTLTGSSGAQLLANRAQLESLDAELAVKQLQVETAAKVAERELAVAQRTLTRVENLSEGGTTTAKQLDQARLEVQLAQQRLQGAKEQLRPYAEARARLYPLLGRSSSGSETGSQSDFRIVLRSPIRGTVVEAHATAGQYLSTGERIFQIVNLDTMWIEARVSEYDLGRVQQAPGASYRLSAYPDQIIPILGTGGGRLIDVGAVVDPQNRTVPVRYEIPNPSGLLRVGMFAEVLVETRRKAHVLAVPAEAVLDEGAESFVIVQTAGETFAQLPVKLGIRDADWVEVLDGLEVGKRVVVHGARAIRLAAMSGALPASDHEH